MERSSGILMPVSSLPSPYGIGTFGKAAYEFADFLRAAGQGYWQMLPLGPTSYGDSPYQSFSTFAGNPYLIDLNLLVADGLVEQKEIDAEDWGNDPRHVDYGKLYEGRFAVLAHAKKRGWLRDKEQVAAFAEENKNWLPDYTLFMALKRHYLMKPWTEWPEDVRLRKSEALEEMRSKLKADIELYTYIQYLFFKQWHALKEYINGLGIKIIGDLPIYVAMDSCDVWAEPEFFQLDEKGYPTAVSGVPPDYFTEDGQLWGNPLYNYERMQQDGFGWWIRRVGGIEKLFDVIRLDHFRGFASYWSVPYGDKTARNGKWVNGPGMTLIGPLTGWFHYLEFIAEDLGVGTPDVKQLLADSGLPGMRVLEFAFDSKEDSNYLPHRYAENSVCYTGTHDNEPLALWKKGAKPEDLEFAQRYLNLTEQEGFNWGIIRGGMCSVAKLFVAQMQDYLELGEGARINAPGTPSGNWTWRMLPGEIKPELTARIRSVTKMYSRLSRKALEEEWKAAEEAWNARVAAEKAEAEKAEQAAKTKAKKA
ncbi:MAG: 4-alpha-glucanotransferase [Oscillospiraceae bacterium]|nr:4-alpha-glucanotransferase [Oscillospiraceae bacterium]